MKLTRADHMARAALLGLHYDPRDGTYCPGETAGDGGVVYSNKGLLDCLTLQPIDVNISLGRMSLWDENADNWPFEDRWELPPEVT